MKRMLAVAAILCAAALTLSGCTGTRSGGGSADPALRGQWELQTAKDAAGALKIGSQRITLTINGTKTPTGRSSCSDYSAKVFGTTSRLWVSAKLSASQSCATRQQETLEARYIRDLDAVRYANATAYVLTLRASGIKLTYSRATRVSLNALTNRTWKVNSIGPADVTIVTAPGAAEDSSPNAASLPPNDDFGEVTGAEATLRFSTSGILTGNDQCRSFASSYSQNAGELLTRNLKSAKYGCGNSALETDAYLMTALASGFTWNTADDELVIDNPRAEIKITFIESPLSGGDLG